MSGLSGELLAGSLMLVDGRALSYFCAVVERERSYVKYGRFPGAYHTDEIFGGPVQNIDMLPVVVPARTK